MDTLLELDGWIVLWLNRGIGHSAVLDGAAYLAVSDYFVPLSMCFWMLGLWFFGPDSDTRSRNQRAVLAAAIALGFANLAVLLLDQSRSMGMFRSFARKRGAVLRKPSR